MVVHFLRNMKSYLKEITLTKKYVSRNSWQPMFLVGAVIVIAIAKSFPKH